MPRALAIALVSALAQPSHAQPAGAEAEMLFRQGKQLMAAGRIGEACAAFDASQKLDPTLPTLLNQANCREQNHQLATAWGLFLEAARRARAETDRASQQMRATAIDRSTRLEPRLSSLQIDVPADSRVDGLEVRRDGEILDPATWNRPLPIDGGTYRISARAPGRAAWSSTVVVGDERDTKIVAVPALAIPAAPPATPAAPAATPAAAAAPPVAPAPEAIDAGTGWSAKRKLAVGVMGGGVLAVAAGGVLGAMAKRKQRDAHDLCPDASMACDGAPRANELIRSGHNLAIEADIAFGVGAAAAITAGVLWLTSAPPGRIAVVPAASPEHIAVTARWSF